MNDNNICRVYRHKQSVMLFRFVRSTRGAARRGAGRCGAAKGGGVTGRSERRVVSDNSIIDAQIE